MNREWALPSAHRAPGFPVQILQLPPGIIECVAQGEKNVLMTRTIDTQAIGVNLCIGYRQVNSYQIGRPSSVTSVTWSFERHMAARDALTELFEARAQFAGAGLESARVIEVMKRQGYR
jgi:hypothetical protein